MIQRLCLYESPGFDPYRNLAIEECLLGQVADCAILYLWQNENTVVVGKNQNPWKECAATLLAEEGGHLARRLSGGGAVYHDLGNLNFTILLPQADYDLDKQLTVIQQAVGSLGIPAQRSGRNDLLAAGQKFSGNAFYKNGKAAYHHGTLLICGDTEKMNRYLTPSKRKLQAKGVDSVRSRVTNLNRFQPDITVAAVKTALKNAFSQVYGLPLEAMPPLPEGEVEALTRRNKSWQWNFGQKRPFTCTLEGRFPWGCAELNLLVENGLVKEAKLFTDAMDTDWVEPIERSLFSCPLEKTALAAALPETRQGRDLIFLLEML